MEPSATLLTSFGFFLALFLWIGAIAARRGTGTERDYLLGGRTYGRWMVGLSAGATGNTGFILLGTVGAGYLLGFGAFAVGLGFLIGEYLFWTFLAKRVAQATADTGAETVAALITCRLPATSAQKVRLVASLLIFVFIGSYLVAQLAGSGKMLSAFFGLAPSTGATIALLLILAYCTTGGLRASIWTDIAQAIIMVVMTGGVLILALIDVGGFSGLMSGLHAIDPALAGFTGASSTAAYLGTVVSFAAIGAGFGLSQPHVTVRLMAGRSANEVKQARWIYLGFVYSTLFAMTLFGVCSRVLLPQIADPEQCLPIYSTTRFAPWLVGVVLAGVFSTIASSADSQLLACSSAISRDMSPRFDAAMTARFGVRYQYAATVLTGLLALLAAIFVSSTVYDLVVFALSVLSATVGAGMLVTILRRPTSALAMSLGMVVGLGVALLWRYAGYSDALSEAVPGLVAAVVTHELIGRRRSVAWQE